MISHENQVETKVVTHPEALSATMKVLVGPADGWEGHVMREFILQKGGHTPKHVHPWPHINYIIEGEGTLFLNGQKNQVEAGSIAYVPNDALHQFENTGDGELRFICIVPEEGHK